MKRAKVLLLLLLSILQYTKFTDGFCIASKAVEGLGDVVKCTNASIDEAQQQGGILLSSLAISASRIVQVMANEFYNHGKTLVVLSLRDCGIRDIDPNAFNALQHLKKLNLPNNQITIVHDTWFTDLTSLEQLDLSFNSIQSIPTNAFYRLSRLQRLDLSNNRLTQLDVDTLKPLNSVAKIRIDGNPLSLMSRGKVTRWLKDRGINYKRDGHTQEFPLDNVIWLCAMDEKIDDTLMKQCVLLNILNQFRLTITSSTSYASSSNECVVERNTLHHCMQQSGPSNPTTNGEATMTLLRAIKSSL